MKALNQVSIIQYGKHGDYWSTTDLIRGQLESGIKNVADFSQNTQKGGERTCRDYLQ